jgi:hypothetical protein
LKNPRDDKKNFGHPRIFHPRRSKAINQLMRPFWLREPESGTAPDIIEIPVIQAIHEGDGGMLAEREGSLHCPLNCGGCDWDPLEYTAHFILGRPFEPPIGKTETLTESIGALVDHVSAWNVDDLQADHESELKRLEMLDKLLELRAPGTPSGNDVVGNQIICKIEGSRPL